MASPDIGYSDFMGRGALFMVINVLVGILLGFLAGLGVGGGSLLILWLTLVAGVDAQIARPINLMFFLFAAGAVSIFRWRKGSLDMKEILPAILTGCVAAGICSWVGTRLEQDILKKIFGILLLITGFREIFYRPRKAK